MSDKDSFDEESDDCGDFTASEDDWQPGDDQSSSTENESGEEAPEISNVSIPKKRSSGHRSANSSRSFTGRRKQLQSLRTKMFNRYKPPPKTFSSPSHQSISEKLSTVLESSQYKKKKSLASSQTGEDSDSSGDDYLVNPKEIDLKSSFFDVTEEKEDAEKPPEFDCNAGMRLSDSEDEEFEEVENKEDAKKKIASLQEGSAATSNSAFKHLHEFAMKMESAKQHLKGFTSDTKKSEPAVDVSQLLAMGEPGVKVETVKAKKRKKVADSDSDWEEVQDFKQIPSTTVSKIQEGIQVTVQLNQEKSREKKTQDEVEAALKRKLNRIIKENQLYFHKVSLLCHIAHGIYCNKALNNPTLMAQALKLLPNKTCYPNGRTEIKYFESIVKWFKTAITIKSDKMYSSFRTRPVLPLSLALQIRNKAAICKKDFVLIFIVLLRAMGIQCRMVINMVPLPIRPAQSDLCRISMKKDDDSEKKTNKEKGLKREQKLNDTKSKKDQEKLFGKEKNTTLNDANSKTVRNSSLSQKTTKKVSANPSTSQTAIKTTKVVTTKEKAAGSQARKKLKPDNVKEESAEKKSSTNSNVRPNVESKDEKPVRKLIKKLSAAKESNPDSSTTSKHFLKRGTNSKEDSTKKEVVVRSTRSKTKQTALNDAQLKTIPQLDGADDAPIKTSRKVRARKAKPIEDPSDSEDDFVPSPPKRKKAAAPSANKSKRDRRVLSSDIEETVEKKNKKNPMDIWIEVFAEEEDQWVTVDLFSGKIHCIDTIRKAATSPIAYVFAWNNDNTIKDVSARYCPQWHTATRKLRIEQEWLDEALEKYVAKKKSARDKKEDRELHRIHLDKPLPTTISEYKNHPLYVLERHLLKFEAIYPPNALTLGFVRGEPVYARECVHTLHSRDIWLKQARTVKLGEKPYKIVKARPKWDRLTNTVIKDQPLEIFGYWQTKQYEPPTAENGIVPRNAYGNVELFKKCMLPKKTVHLQLPGLNKVCKKLNIDCAPAVVGFDFHQGMCHPLIDGFVVCEEFQDQVVAAWHQEQEEAERKEEEKYLQRVYGNWKKLIRGLMIREKLKRKYNFEGFKPEEKEKTKRSKKKT